MLFSLCSGMLWQFAARRWGIWPAVGSVGAWVLQPNLFGHGHYATYDAVLSSLWVLAIIAFTWAVEIPPGARKTRDWVWVLIFGLCVGCALATKLTGWFLPLPFLAWTAWRRDRRVFRILLVGLVVATATLFLLNPPWWSEPITGVVRFLQSNLTRGRTRPIPVQFLGTTYLTPNQSLPWYNTLVWTVMVTPVGFLAFSLAGMIRAVIRRRDEPLGLLILGNWALLMVLRSLPHTPGHDGVRLFLPAFGILALLVGMGVKLGMEVVGGRARFAVIGALAEGAVSIVLMMPVPLSYFSPLVGGLPGAARLGMEPTYYWDSLNAESRAWLRAHTEAGQTIQFATYPTSWLYLRSTGELPDRVAGIDPGRPAWFVLQNRPGEWTRDERQLVENGTPAMVVRKMGVPLVWIFPIAERERWRGNSAGSQRQ